MWEAELPSTLTLNPGELQYLRRAVQRDIEDFDEESMNRDMEEYALAEVALACEVLKVLTRAIKEVQDAH